MIGIWIPITAKIQNRQKCRIFLIAFQLNAVMFMESVIVDFFNFRDVPSFFLFLFWKKVKHCATHALIFELLKNSLTTREEICTISFCW